MSCEHPYPSASAPTVGDLSGTSAHALIKVPPITEVIRVTNYIKVGTRRLANGRFMLSPWESRGGEIRGPFQATQMVAVKKN